MARRGGGQLSTQLGISNANHLPPPSTIAAQILHNHIRSNNVARQEPENDALFGQLLQEYLRNPMAEEATVETNAQLISVVVEAGLDVLVKDNPFTPDTLTHQAKDSLTVISYTIEKIPGVLLFTGIGNDGDNLPLFLWLLPKILKLLGRRHTAILQNDLCNVLTTSIRSLQQTTQLWRHADSLRDIITAVVEDIVSSLETQILLDRTGTKKLSVSLPSSRSMSALWPKALEVLVVPQAYQTRITDASQTHLIALDLISVLTNCSLHSDSPVDTTSTLMVSRWTLDVCHRLLRTSRSCFDEPSQDMDRFLSLLLSSVFEAYPIDDNLSKVGPLLDLFVEVLWAFKQHGGRALHDTLVKYVNLLLGENRHPGVVESCKRRFLPLLSTHKNEDIHMEQDDFQHLLDTIHSFFYSKDQANANGDNRPSKRQRIGENATKDSWEVAYSGILKSVTSQLAYEARDFVLDLSETAPDRFDALSLEEKYKALANLGALPCAASGCLSMAAASPRILNTCAICDRHGGISSGDSAIVTWDEIVPDDYKGIIEALSSLLQSAELRKSKKARVTAAHAIRRMVNHTNDREILSVGSGVFGPWLMRSLQSSSRELRIASTHSLMAYLREDVREDVRTKNRREILDFLRCLTDRNNASEHESLVTAWGLVGRHCGQDELNLALIQLVDFLGHTHPVISGAAYHEILKLAKDLDRMPMELFKPFWSSVALHVVKDLIARPQRVQQLSELLGISVNDFLLLTQTETIPYLILTRRRDVLLRIAQARGPAAGVQDLWLQPSRNLAAVISLLFIQPSPDPELAAIGLLKDVAPDFTEHDLSNLVRVDPILIACAILKEAADGQDSKQQAHQAFRLLAMASERKPGGQSKALKPAKALSSFLEAHVLGIMSHFTDIIDSSLEKQPLAEKTRALKAVEQLITLAKSQAGIALPQSDLAIRSSTKSDDIESLIDHTFAIIVQNWRVFSHESQIRARDTIADLLKNHNTLIRDRIDMIPSLKHIALLDKFEAEINRFKSTIDPTIRFEAFGRRVGDENFVIVHQALIELVPFLETHQRIIHESAVSQQPHALIAKLSRALLDAIIRFKESHHEILPLCGQCLGIIGCIDPNRVDSTRERRDIMMLSNFEKADEVISFVAHLLETVIAEAFHAASTGKAQTYLAYVMQELLKFCGFRQAVVLRPKSSQLMPTFQRWSLIPEAVRSTLTPYFNTKYVIVHAAMPTDGNDFPIFNPGLRHGTWLRKLVFILLHRAQGENAQMIFPVLSRVIWGHDITIPSFLLPFVVLNVVVGGSEDDSADILTEFLEVLTYDMDDASHSQREDIKQCSENIFQTLDYLSRWLQEKKKALTAIVTGNSRSHVMPTDFDEIRETTHISSVERILTGIPAAAISRRAVQCRSYARALFHWEQHIRQISDTVRLKKQEPPTMEEEFKHLQHIYAQIDEPDAIEGISTRLQILDPEQQVLEYKRAGRWTAAQSWYEIALGEKPADPSLEVDLFNCLKSSGRYGSLLDTVRGFCPTADKLTHHALPFATEAAWMTGKWDALDSFLKSEASTKSTDFNVGVGKVMLAMLERDPDVLHQTIDSLRQHVVQGLSESSTASLAAAHPFTLKLHALYELEVTARYQGDEEGETFKDSMDRRLDIIGAFTDDKQYLLGIRRAAMQFSDGWSNQQQAANWLTSARLYRKAGLTDAAYDAVLRATQLHDGAAKIEHTRLLWVDGYHRKAIQNLQGAIETNSFQAYTISAVQDTLGPTADDQGQAQNLLVAKTQLLLAKWMDSAGQIKSEDLRKYYLNACNSFRKWEKGHYYIGKHYLKILESEKAAPDAKKTVAFLSGDCQKLVIENFLRSMVFGAKYYYQTIPKVLTLWLDLGAELHEVEKHPRSLDQYHSIKVKKLDTVNKQVKKYVERLPGYVFYTAFPQIMSRINHPYPKVSDAVMYIITRIAMMHPQQALWSILAVAKAKATDKASRATMVLNKLKQIKTQPGGLDIKALIAHGVKITHALLAACEIAVDTRMSRASLQRDLGFKHSLAPCLLVVPVETTMTASLPTGTGGLAIRSHKPFPKNTTTIAAFLDDVLVLSSLQRPRKLTIRGSDGEQYGLLCKPKDDLRKDQRLMEFTSMIDRALKRDVESSKRRLYIRTYAVTPLNEECGAIEWVDGLKPMRDIILASLKAKGVKPDYGEIRQLLDKACSDIDHGSAKIFTEQIQPKFPLVLHEWFVEVFPEPESWLAARLRYTRSCAVMSIVGHVLGLGDRHGENILLQENTGGVFHVDFNCLFDKGLTFEKPELVPFRLTANMVDAMGSYGYEGPYRTAAELTLKILKQYEDTLMTIMETFLYDPTTDFIAKPKKRTRGVPETPAEVLESVRGKVGGWLPGETVPLSVDGYVDALIKMAVDPARLTSMYIGWCAFF
ncbi:ABC1 family protein [Venturia nashicola]|nr:ABC1 family protein [Venturia nashicola]